MKRTGALSALLLLAGCFATTNDLDSLRQTIDNRTDKLYASKEEVAQTYETKAAARQSQEEIRNHMKREVQTAVAPVKEIKSNMTVMKKDVKRIEKEQKDTVKKLSDLELAAKMSRRVMMDLIRNTERRVDEHGMGRLHYIVQAKFRSGSAELTPEIMFELNRFIVDSEGQKLIISRIYGYYDKDSIKLRGWGQAEALGYSRAQAVCDYIFKHVFVRPYDPRSGSPFLSARKPDKKSTPNNLYSRVVILGERAP